MTNPTLPQEQAPLQPDHGVALVHDLRMTDLTPTERQSLARSRYAAFGILVVCSLLAIPLAIYCWYLWALTAQECLALPSKTFGELLLFNITSASSWQSYLIGLDISSFSALTLALLFTRLAYLGTRNTVHHYIRDRGEFFGRAYHSVLFSEGFETLCVRFGLLGTLLSFTLVAVLFMGKSGDAGPQVEEQRPAVAVSTSPDETNATLRDAERTETIRSSDAAHSSEKSTGTELVSGTPAASSAESWNGESAATGSKAEQFTNSIFILLCASLVSTFVGTGVAYAITPSLNWINERALGLHQLSQADARFAAEEFFRQVSRTSERLAQFEATTVRLGEAAQHMRSFEENISASARQLAGVIGSFDSRVDHTSKRLAELVAGLERAVHVFDVSTLTGKQLAKKLDNLEAMSDRVSELLSQLPDRLNDPLKNMSLTAGKFREAAMTGEAAFKELREMAGATHDAIGQTTQRTNSTWQVLHEVQVSLKALADNELRQTMEVAKVSQALEAVGLSLDQFIDRIGGPPADSPEQSRSGRDGHDRDHPHLDGRASHSPSATRGNRTVGDLREPGIANRPNADREVRTHRSWWRRLFG
jgi:methyl-accepting chemotaxis protein